MCNVLLNNNTRRTLHEGSANVVACLHVPYSRGHVGGFLYLGFSFPFRVRGPYCSLLLLLFLLIGGFLPLLKGCTWASYWPRGAERLSCGNRPYESKLRAQLFFVVLLFVVFASGSAYGGRDVKMFKCSVCNIGL
jgi:hypothetical protein